MFFFQGMVGGRSVSDNAYVVLCFAAVAWPALHGRWDLRVVSSSRAAQLSVVGELHV